MAEKLKGKSLGIIIVVAVIAVLVIVFAIFKVTKGNNAWKQAKNADDIVISDKDSDQVKIEKLQKKKELLNGQIEDIQLKLNPELEKLNSLYQEYVDALNNTEETSEPEGEEHLAE